MLKSAFSRGTPIALLGLFFLLAIGFTPDAIAQGPINSKDNPDPVYEIVPWEEGDIVKGEVLVQFKKGLKAATRGDLHRSMGTERIEQLEGGLDLVRFEGRTIDEMLDLYNGHPSVEFAEPNIVYYPVTTPNDSSFGSQWGPKKINCPNAWDIHTGNSSHLCAVIDTGLDMGHGDFDGQYAGGWDYYSNDNNPNDNDGHGTHCSGIVAAKTNNNKGVAGVAWNCRLLIYRVGNYSFPTTAIVNSINAAKNAGALAISMSFSGPSPSSSITNALTSANNAGVVCVAAAGNDGNTGKDYPAASAPVIAVASSNSSDNRSSFSNYGTWVEVAAPGQNILSCYDGNSYAYADGTSMACPHVAGMATILYSKLGGVRNKANADTVRAAIEDTCVPKSWVEFGRVDLAAAMNVISPPSSPTLAAVQPQQVQAFQGGTMTLTGTNFAGVSQVTVAGVAITGTDITLVNGTEIKVPAPTAPGGLGQFNVTVTNSAGTSNPRTFNYVETSPPKLQTPLNATGGSTFTWEFGAGANDIFVLVLSTAAGTVPFKGYDVLQSYIVILVDTLSPAGVGDLSVTVPGNQGTTFIYNQLFTFDENGSHPFTGASNVSWSLILD